MVNRSVLDFNKQYTVLSRTGQDTAVQYATVYVLECFPVFVLTPCADARVCPLALHGDCEEIGVLQFWHSVL